MLEIEEKRLFQLKKNIIKLGNEIIQLNELIYEHLSHDDISSLVQIKTKEKSEIEAMADAIDNEAISILSLYSPSAKDLRKLIAFLKISGELVRVYSNSISFIQKFYLPFQANLKKKKILKHVLPMQRMAVDALRTSIEMLSMDQEENIKQAYSKVYMEENQTDELFQLAEKNIMKLSSSNIELTLDYLTVLSAIRRVERVSDRALSIASILYYAKLGGELRQDLPPDDLSI